MKSKIIALVFWTLMFFLVSSACSNGPSSVDEVSVYAVRTTYESAKNVYIGQVTAIRPLEPETDFSRATYAFTVRVQEVFKGSFSPGEAVEDFLSREFFSHEAKMACGGTATGTSYHNGVVEVGGTYLMMTGVDEDAPMAEHIMDNSFYNAIRLLENGQLQFYFVEELLAEGDFDNYEGNVLPPKSYAELVQQLETPLP